MARTTAIAVPLAHLVGPGKLRVINGQLAYSTGDGQPLRLDPGELRTLLCYGEVGVSDTAFTLLFLHDVQVAWLTAGGTKYRGRLVKADPAAAALRLVQYRVLTHAEGRLHFARQTVCAKIASQMHAARYFQRHGNTTASSALAQLESAQRHASAAKSIGRLCGIEGGAANAWFNVFAAALRSPWTFSGRVRRPPTDPINALLSLGYTWLATRVAVRCEAAGLEIYLGALHAYRPGRPSLACDLMESLRIAAVDRWVLTLLNRQERKPADFVATESHGIRLRGEVFPSTLHHWEEAWLKGGHADALDQIVEAFAQSLRHWQLPDVPDSVTEGL